MHTDPRVLPFSFCLSFLLIFGTSLLFKKVSLEPTQDAPLEVEIEPRHTAHKKAHITGKRAHTAVSEGKKTAPPASSPLSTTGAVVTQPQHGDSEQNEVAEEQPDHEATAIYAPKPEIPETLRYRNLHTFATIECIIALDGSVKVALVRSSGEPLLDHSALRTAELWHFMPAEKNGEKVISKTKLKFFFDVK